MLLLYLNDALNTPQLPLPRTRRAASRRAYILARLPLHALDPTEGRVISPTYDDGRFHNTKWLKGKGKGEWKRKRKMTLTHKPPSLDTACWKSFKNGRGLHGLPLKMWQENRLAKSCTNTYSSQVQFLGLTNLVCHRSKQLVNGTQNWEYWPVPCDIWPSNLIASMSFHYLSSFPSRTFSPYIHSLFASTSKTWLIRRNGATLSRD